MCYLIRNVVCMAGVKKVTSLLSYGCRFEHSKMGFPFEECTLPDRTSREESPLEERHESEFSLKVFVFNIT